MTLERCPFCGEEMTQPPIHITKCEAAQEQGGPDRDSRT